MFTKLAAFLQKDKSDHPLGSEQNLGLLLREIPQNSPSRVLIDIDHWIEDIGRYDTELQPAVLRQALFRLEEFAQPAYEKLILAYVLPGTRDYHSDLLWSYLERHSKLVFLAYAHCLDVATRSGEDLSRERMALALCSARAMQAWVERKKLLQFRYRPPETEWWGAAHNLITTASKLGVIGLAQPLYEDSTISRSTVHAYLAGLYLELAPVANLITLQIEVVHRWLQQNANTFEFVDSPNAGTTHYIDLTQNTSPNRYNAEQGVVSGNIRYCSTRRLRAPLVQLAHQVNRMEDLPEWLQAFRGEKEALQGLLHVLMQHWSDKPPQRTGSREDQKNRMRVVHGFNLARRMIACSSFAKRGMALNYRGADLENLFNELRFGRTAQSTKKNVDEEDVPVDPFETLEKLETSGDKQMMDNWLQTDASPQGLGAVLPGLRARNKIGELVCFRVDDDLDWCLGVIRRIGRDREKRANIGLETFPRPSLCAQVFAGDPVTSWSDANSAATSSMDAILVSTDSNQLIIPLGVYEENLALTLSVEGELRSIRVVALIDKGDDWEMVRFEPIENEETA